MSIFKWLDKQLRDSNQAWINNPSSSGSSKSSCRKCCSNCTYLTHRSISSTVSEDDPWSIGGPYCIKHDIEFKVPYAYGKADYSVLDNKTCDDFYAK